MPAPPEKSSSLKLSEAKEVYIGLGQEIAVYGFTHPFLEKLDSAETIYEIAEYRSHIEEN